MLITARPLRPLFALGLPEVRVLAVEGLARMLPAACATSARAARGTWADRDDAMRALRTRGAVPRGLLVADDAAQRSCLLNDAMPHIELAELHQRVGGIRWGVGRAGRPRLRRRRQHRLGRMGIVHQPVGQLGCKLSLIVFLF